MQDFSRYREIFDFKALVFIIVLIMVEAAHAEVIMVCPNGCSFNSTQKAIDAANPGDIIEVQIGTYPERVIISKQITLRGQNTSKNKPVIDAFNSGNAVTLLADGITLDGFNITNSYFRVAKGWTGIDVVSNNNTIKNNIVFDNENGMAVKSLNNTIMNNDVINNYHDGINFQDANRNKITDNIIYKNGDEGFEFKNSSKNTIIGNNVSSNKNYGIWIKDSTNNTLIKNFIFDNKYNFALDGWSRLHFNNDINTSNLLNGKPIYYLIGALDRVIDSHAGTIYCIDCSNITIRDLNLSHNSHGICLYNTSNSRIENNSLSDNLRGIDLYYCSNNVIKNNDASDNKDYGISIHNSSNITLTRNSMSGNGYNFVLEGFDRQHFNNSIDITNHVNEKSIYFLVDARDESIDLDSNAGTVYCIDCIRVVLSDLTLIQNSHGIYFYNTSYSRIDNCSLNNNHYGVYLQNSGYNKIVDNNANSNKDYGLYLTNSSNNYIADNNANNNEQNNSNFWEPSYKNRCYNNTVSPNIFGGRKVEFGPVSNPFRGRTTGTPVLRIQIDSSPRGAEISVDGENKGLITPNIVKIERKGNHSIQLSLSGYEHFKEWYYITSSSQKIKINLSRIQPPKASDQYVSIDSVPRGASICIDKEFIGNFTPYKIYFDSFGNHTYELFLSGYENYEGNLRVPVTKSINITLTPKKPETSSKDTDSGNNERNALPDIPAVYSLANIVLVYYFSKRYIQYK